MESGTTVFGISILIVHMYMLVRQLTQYFKSSLRLRDETVWPEPTVYLVHVLLILISRPRSLLVCFLFIARLNPLAATGGSSLNHPIHHHGQAC